MTHTDILNFWFSELSHEDRFNGGESIDTRITKRFAGLHREVVHAEHSHWRATPEGALAEIIVLDQFSRNIHRGEAAAFAVDGQALTLAQVAIERGFDDERSAEQNLFLYLPFMHSESAVIHETAVPLFTKLGNEEALAYERKHKDIIDRFGRYPHRNEQLGRKSTPEELEYLQETNEAFFAS